MKRFLSVMVLGAVPLMLPSAPAVAVEYTQLQAEQSRVAFQYEQMGVRLDGHFRTFSSDIHFDPARPEAAKAVLEVDLASVDTGSPDADTEVVTPGWFNVAAYPKARFEASSIKALDGERYEIAGKLSIKGAERAVSFPATFHAKGEQATFQGSLTIKRGDYSIGEGDWSSFDIVANDVVINFELAVKAGK